MNPFWIRVRAPFAAFRVFQAGIYRSTAPVMPPSTAFGLILNLAGIEMRTQTNAPITLISPDLPKICLAIGTIAVSEKSSLYQQLHSYPVGASGQEHKARSFGAKYWIAPVRREVLVGYDGIIGVKSDDSGLIEQIKKGLSGENLQHRYGLPFAGDNNFLIDRIDILDTPPTNTSWYSRMRPDDPPRKGSYRLTIGINRADNSKTSSAIYAPLDVQTTTPPENVWTWVPS